MFNAAQISKISSVTTAFAEAFGESQAKSEFAIPPPPAVKSLADQEPSLLTAVLASWGRSASSAEMVKGEAVNSLVNVARHCRELMFRCPKSGRYRAAPFMDGGTEEQAAMTARHLDDAGQDPSTPPCS